MPQQPMQQPIQQSQALQMGQAQQQTPPTQQNQAVQNGDFFVVASEDDVFRWAVAPGNLVTFKIENQPVLIEKSLGFSKFDSPHYERYRLVKEEMISQQAESQTEKTNERYEVLEDKVKSLTDEVSSLKEQIAELTAKKPAKSKKEVEADE